MICWVASTNRFSSRRIALRAGSIWPAITIETARVTGQPGEYDPPLDDGTVPSSKLRKLEISANSRLSIRIERCTSKAVYRLSISGISMAVDLRELFFLRKS
ncbi:hypothetical protein BDZ89DRAFT_1066056 [Hymenopellis radicata]|nr:hypothetical protein BDZ89DRAFT_1066056 [Hymenopellis radicata]